MRTLSSLVTSWPSHSFSVCNRLTVVSDDFNTFVDPPSNTGVGGSEI